MLDYIRMAVCSFNGQIFLNVVQYEVVFVVAHCFFEGADAFVAPFGLVSRLNLRLRGFSGRLSLSLFDLFCVDLRFSTVCGLLDMQMRVPVNVQAVGALILEEKFLKESLELVLCNAR